MKTILLIDASNFLFRAYHALPPLTTKDGRPTGAVRGFLSMMKTLREDVPTDYIACVFDPKGKTFRHEIYPEYKANRPPMPEDLRCQIETVFEAIRKVGVPLLQVPGVEADDTIGTIAKKAAAEGLDVVIATGDKDYAQLVEKNIRLINTMGAENTWMNRDGVIAKFGVPPEHIIDYLALMGDTVDNVPGVRKCGPKTAAKWVSEYGTVENLIANADKVKGKIGESLREGAEFLPMAKDLVTIRTDVDLTGYVSSFEDLKAQEPDVVELYHFFNDLEFRRWANELKLPAGAAVRSAPKKAEPTPAPAPMGDLFGFVEEAPVQAEHVAEPEVVETVLSKPDLMVIRNAEEAKDAVKKLEGKKAAVYLLIDGEYQQQMLVSGFCITTDADAFYVPVSRELIVSEGLSAEEASEIFGSWFASVSPKVFYDAKTSRHALNNSGIQLKGIADDVLLQSYVYEAHRSKALDKLCSHWLKTEITPEEALLGKGVKKLAYRDVALQAAADYAFDRAWSIYEMHLMLGKAINASPELTKIYRSIELPLSSVLYRMEENGVLIDSVLLTAQTAELTQAVERIEADAYNVAGEVFKLSSPKALGEVLFEKMGAVMAGSKPKKTASGSYSTSEEVLSELALDYPLAKLALEYRGLTKLISTYTDKLPKMADAKDGRVHTTFEQAVAVTGRLSSTNPNLQNIPVRTAEGRRVREAFVAEKGCRIISADYSQIELRIMAHLSGDKGLIDAFRNGMDIHRTTAAEVFRIKPEEVTPDQRRIAKVVNFGLIYGMSAFGLAKNLGIERTEAKNYIERYFEHFPGVRRYMDEIRAKASAEGFVETVFGRRLYLPEIHAAGPRRAAAERAAINAPMQGTAADLIKMAMLRVHEWLETSGLKSRMILQVHDELILEVPEDEVEIVKVKLPEIMNSVAELHVPLLAEVGVGSSWEAAH